MHIFVHEGSGCGLAQKKYVYITWHHSRAYPAKQFRTCSILSSERIRVMNENVQIFSPAYLRAFRLRMREYKMPRNEHSINPQYKSNREIKSAQRDISSLPDNLFEVF